MKGKSDREGRKITPLDGLLRTPQVWEKRDKSGFETGVVTFLFQHFGLPARIRWELQQDCRAKTGEYGLLLEDFHQRFPDLPVRLVVGRFRHLQKSLTVSTMFNSFSAQPFVTAYAKAYEEADETERGGRTFALVHYWPHVPQRAMVVHEKPPEILVHGVRVHCVVTEKKKSRVTTWEPLTQLLRTIDRDAGGKWRPVEDG